VLALTIVTDVHTVIFGLFRGPRHELQCMLVDLMRTGLRILVWQVFVSLWGGSAHAMRPVFWQVRGPTSPKN